MKSELNAIKLEFIQPIICFLSTCMFIIIIIYIIIINAPKTKEHSCFQNYHKSLSNNLDENLSTLASYTTSVIQCFTPNQRLEVACKDLKRTCTSSMNTRWRCGHMTAPSTDLKLSNWLWNSSTTPSCDYYETWQLGVSNAYIWSTRCHCAYSYNQTSANSCKDKKRGKMKCVCVSVCTKRPCLAEWGQSPLPSSPSAATWMGHIHPPAGQQSFCGHTLQAWGPGFCIHGPSHPILRHRGVYSPARWPEMGSHGNTERPAYHAMAPFSLILLMNENLYSTGEYF